VEYDDLKYCWEHLDMLVIFKMSISMNRKVFETV